jgi:hypothetical protein
MPQPLLAKRGSLLFTASLEIDQVEIELYVRYDGKVSGLLRSPIHTLITSQTACGRTGKHILGRLAARRFLKCPLHPTNRAA